MAKIIEIPLTFEAEAFVAKAAQAATKHGVTFHGNAESGWFSGLGAEGEYRIEDNILYLTIQKKPALIPWSFIESKIREFLE